MKYIKMILFTLIICFFVSVNEVNASGVQHGYDSNYVNKCADNQTCMLLCGYTNKVRYTNESVEAKYDYYSSYIYYDFLNQDFFVEWMGGEKDSDLAKNHKELSKISHISDSAKKNLTDYGVCPQYSNIDVDGWGWETEVCFGDNSEYCPNQNNIGTKYKGTSSLEYNYRLHVYTYFNEWKTDIKNYSTEALINQNINLEEAFTKDFSQNFLNNNPIPDFIKNSTVYQNGLELFENEIIQLKEKCESETTQKYQQGLISTNEYQTNINLCKTGAEELEGQLEQAQENINEGGNSNQGGNIEQMDCSSLLGDPDDEGDPAFYLTKVFHVIKYVAILLLLVMSILDFVGAVASSDSDVLKKATNKLITRAILCVVIFVLPTLIELVLNIINENAINACVIK